MIPREEKYVHAQLHLHPHRLLERGVIVQVCVGADLLVGRLQVAPQDGCTENEINDLLEKHVQGFLCRCAATRMHFDIWGIYQLLPTFKNIKKKPKPSIYPHKPW